MTTVYKPIEFVVDGLLAQGLYILAGAPKVGKSWLVLDMCLSSKGRIGSGARNFARLGAVSVFRGQLLTDTKQAIRADR